MTQIEELAKDSYKRIVEIMTSTDRGNMSEISRMGAILAVCEHFDLECDHVTDE